MIKVKNSKVENIIINFFIYAFLGWILETIYALYIERTFIKRGFLFGPICPIYGFGAVILIGITGYIKKKNVNTVETFFISMVIFTFFEYIVSFVFEKIFGIRWWDYSNEFLNLQGRICLAFSVFWGVFGVVFINKLYKPSQEYIEKIKNRLPQKYLKIILLILMVLISIDMICSIIRYIIL